MTKSKKIDDLRQYRVWGLFTLLQLMGLLVVGGFLLTALLNYFF
jgi:hypothetical protein